MVQHSITGGAHGTPEFDNRLHAGGAHSTPEFDFEVRFKRNGKKRRIGHVSYLWREK